MHELKRRDFLALAAAPLLLSQQRAAFAQAKGQAPPPPRLGSRLTVCMHEASSERFDFRAAMEGYAKAGVRYVEPNLLKVQEFAKKEGGPMAAKRLLDDLGLLPASSSNQLFLMEPGEQRLKSIEELKWKVEMAQAIGADRLVTPSAGNATYTEDDYKRGVDNMREAAEIAKPFGVTLMLEFARTSRFAGPLPAAPKLMRETNHPNYRVMP